jgi:hypothetical protein
MRIPVILRVEAPCADLTSFEGQAAHRVPRRGSAHLITLQGTDIGQEVLRVLVARVRFAGGGKIATWRF